jgi:hypothetical protein
MDEGPWIATVQQDSPSAVEEDIYTNKNQLAGMGWEDGRGNATGVGAQTK